MKIVVLDAYATNPGDLSWEGLKKFGTVTFYDRTAKDEILERISDAELVLTNKTPLRKEILEKASQLKYIGVLATGTNVVDVADAQALGITVTNIPGYSTDSVAQLTISLMLELAMHIDVHTREVHEGRWSNGQDFTFRSTPLIELAGKTLGILGYGVIGQKVGLIAESLGMRVIVSQRRPKPLLGNATAVDLDTLYATSDVITLHIPLTPESKHMVNAQSIAKMKKGVWIINTARGPIIDELALREALLSGQVGQAGLDVLSEEPPAKDHPLIGLSNCVITPHIAWSTLEARTRLIDIACQNIQAYLDHQPIHVVKA